MIILSDDNSKNIDFIFHISDIHIRLYQRKTEYSYVFEKLFAYLSTHKKQNNNIIVVTGDIVHSKNELSPECETMTFDFLSTLASIFPTFIIAGNHDALLNNRHRLDTLSSILHRRNTTNLYFLKGNLVYQFHNIYFYVDSLLDEISIDMTKKYSPNGIHIALFHGSIPGWKNAKGFTSDIGEKYLEEFSGMDYVLLGDIHAFQYMSNKKPVAAYASSLISQNFGETDPYHGILIWDLLHESQSFQPIPNPFRHQDVYLLPHENVSTDDRKSSLEDAKIAKWGQIRVHALQDEIYSQRMFSDLQKLYPEANFHLKRTNHENSISTTNANTMSDDITSLKEFLQKNVPATHYDEIYKFFLEKWQEQETFPIQWEIISITFSNLFGYGKSNHIDFSSSKNIIGIFGNNSVGKSTIVDIISLLLFDKVTRLSHGQSIPKEVIHVDETKANGEIILKIASETYIIQKEYKRQKNDKIKLSTKFFKLSSTKNKTELTGEQRKKTNQFIEQIIGKYDTFIYINSYLQQREQSFREMTPTVKKRFMNDLYGYHWFSILEKQIKEEIKSLELEYSVTNDFNINLLSQKEVDTSSILEAIKNITEKIQFERLQLERLKKQKEDKLLNITWTKEKYDDRHSQLSEKIQTIEISKGHLEKSISNAENFLSSWKNNPLVQDYSTFSQSIFVKEWHPKNKPHNEWKNFYQRLQDSSSYHLEDIRSSLHQKLKEYSETVIEINQDTLSWYSLLDQSKIENFVKDQQKHEEKNASLLKKLYSSLTFPLDTPMNYFLNEKKRFSFEIQKLQDNINSQVHHLKKIENIRPLLQNEKISDFVALHHKWKMNSIYQKFSPFFQSKKSLWDSESKIFHSFVSINNENLQNDMKQIEHEIDRLHSEKSLLPPGKISSSPQTFRKLSLTKLTPIQNVFDKWDDNDQSNLFQLQRNETTIALLHDEIKISQSTIDAVTFVPNPNCSVCLKNRDYLDKLSKQEQIIKKQKTIKKLSTLNKNIMKDFCKKFLLDTISSSSDFVEQKQNHILRFHEFKRKQKDIDDAIIILQNHEHYLTQQNLSTQIASQKKKLLEKKEIFSKSYHYHQHSELYQYLYLQWKYSPLMPFHELEQIIQTHSKINDATVQQMQNDLIQLQNDFKNFESKFQNDIETRNKISTMENDIDELKKNKKWLEEVDKSVQKNNQVVQLKKINELQDLENYLVILQQNADTIPYLKTLWQRPELWDADILQIVQKITFLENDLIDSKNNIENKNIEMSNLTKQLSEIKNQWETDQGIYSMIETIESASRSHLENINEMEKELLSAQLKYQTIHENDCLQKENEKKLYSLKKEIQKKKLLHRLLDKDGISLYLLGKKMIILETQMNELLTPFLPKKKIRFFIDEKQIQFGLVAKSNPTNMVNLFGGMESFVLELVIKLTFSKYSILPRSNFFVIDEGISVLDQQNIANIDYLFKFLSQLVTNVLLISHLPQIQDFVDESMYISKSNNKSNVIFGRRNITLSKLKNGV